MLETYTDPIDWIFDALKVIFQFMMSSWILAFVVLISLLSIVISIYLSSKSR